VVLQGPGLGAPGTLAVSGAVTDPHGPWLTSTGGPLRVTAAGRLRRVLAGTFSSVAPAGACV